MSYSTSVLPRRDRARSYAIGRLPAPGAIEGKAGFDYFVPTLDLRTRRHHCAQGCRSCRDPEALVYLAGDSQAQAGQLARARVWAMRAGITLGWVAGEVSAAVSLRERRMLAGVLGLVAWHPNPVLLVGELVLDDPDAAAVAEKVRTIGGRFNLIPVAIAA